MCIYNGHKDNNDGIERLVAFNFRAIAQGENDYEFVGLQSELTGMYVSMYVCMYVCMYIRMYV